MEEVDKMQKHLVLLRKKAPFFFAGEIASDQRLELQDNDAWVKVLWSNLDIREVVRDLDGPSLSEAKATVKLVEPSSPLFFFWMTRILGICQE